jgi:hypothetical protein
LSALIRDVKAHSSRRVREACPARAGAVWADGFHDRALRWEEQLVDVARYIVLNPVRAGLVARVGDYSYWDAIWI